MRGRWPLHTAAMRGQCDVVRDLIENSYYDPNQKMVDWFDCEPLGWAASYGHLATVITLIQLGADPRRPANKACSRPLDDARRERYHVVTRFLEMFDEAVDALMAEDSLQGAQLLPE